MRELLSQCMACMLCGGLHYQHSHPRVRPCIHLWPGGGVLFCVFAGVGTSMAGAARRAEDGPRTAGMGSGSHLQGRRAGSPDHPRVLSPPRHVRDLAHRAVPGPAPLCVACCACELRPCPPRYQCICSATRGWALWDQIQALGWHPKHVLSAAHHRPARRQPRVDARARSQLGSGRSGGEGKGQAL